MRSNEAVDLYLRARRRGQPAASVWDGVYSEEQAGRGKPLYVRECAACHGSSMNGGEEAPPLTGAAFLANWSGLTAGDLFERIRLSMPEGWPGTLSRQKMILFVTPVRILVSSIHKVEPSIRAMGTAG